VISTFDNPGIERRRQFHVRIEVQGELHLAPAAFDEIPDRGRDAGLADIPALEAMSPAWGSRSR
jgi:hypothetical protein